MSRLSQAFRAVCDFAQFRKLHRWHWLLRYWALDKYPQQARWAAAAAVTVVAALAAREALRPPAPGEPAQAWFLWVVLALVAVFVSLALTPRPPPPDPQEGQAPETKDGKQLVRVYGTVWIDDPAITGWVNNTPEPIRKKAGKK